VCAVVNRPVVEIDLEAIERLPTEGERAQARLEAAHVGRQMESNPLWRYVPHEGEYGWKKEHGVPLQGDESRGQVAFHELNRSGCWMGAAVTGNRFGKTTGVLADNLIQTLEPELVPFWLEPYRKAGSTGEFFCRIVVVDLQTIARVIWPTLRKIVPPEALYKGSMDKAYTERLASFAVRERELLGPPVA
jgi:hypothetical protein